MTLTVSLPKGTPWRSDYFINRESETGLELH